jgi:hypothetical protein
MPPQAVRRRSYLGERPRIVGVSTSVQPLELHQLSIEEYHQIVACVGFAQDTRVELIDGLIVDMSPKTPQHENAVRWLIDWLVSCLDHGRYQHMVSAPLAGHWSAAHRRAVRGGVPREAARPASTPAWRLKLVLRADRKPT